MSLAKVRLFTCAAVLGLCTSIFAQTNDSLIEQEIERELQSSIFHYGPFYLAPKVFVGGGYDSNPLSSSLDPQPDVAFLATPAVNVVIPFKRRAMLEIYEEVDLLYYREQTELNGAYNATRVGGTIGARKVMMNFAYDFIDIRARPTSEVDVPLNQTSTQYGGGLTFALGSKQQLNLNYSHYKFRIDDQQFLVDDVIVSRALDRTEDAIRVNLTRILTSKTSALLEGFFEKQDFSEEDTRNPNNDQYGLLAGVAFTPTEYLSGRMLLGYKRINPDVPEQAYFSGLIGSVDAFFRPVEWVGFGVIYSRNSNPSVRENNWFYIENQYGGSVRFFVSEAITVSTGATWGTNSYPRPAIVEDSNGEETEVKIKDDFNNFSINLTYRFSEHWRLNFGAIHQSRDVNVPLTEKRRWYGAVGISSQF